MKTKRKHWQGILAALFIGVGMPGIADRAMAQPAAENEEDMEVMTRGPVHEAFAETVVFDPEPVIIVSKQPPELIEEVQPDQRPVGTNVSWIPGYWAWDEDNTDFLWISGVWRNLPPGREWIPGYWAQVDTGHQWTSGYWQDAETTEVSYLPEPPRTLEKGPSVAASSDNETWVPGSWQYRDDRYAWRAGYWVAARPNWAWTPSYYRWTHRGYVYVDGYWDYPVVNRGVVFAPVRFHRGYHQRPGYYYSPATVISLAVFSSHLFVRPNYGHYYFGDYYDSGYRDRYYASYSYGSRYRGGYDPIYAHARWEHRHDRNWERQRQEYFEHRRDNVGSRPPRTWAAYNRLPERDRERGDFRVADRYDRVVGDREGRVRFQKVSDDERQRFASQRTEMRSFRKERQEREFSGERAKKDGDGRGQASRVKVNRSPMAAKRDDRDEKAGGPPPRLQRRDADDSAANERGNKKDGPNADRPMNDNAKRDGNADGGKKAANDREDRTKPGQRRDEGEAGRKPKQDAGGNAGRDGKPKDSQPGEANRGEGKKQNPRPDNTSGGKKEAAPKREAAPGNKGKATPEKKKEAPQPKRDAAQQPQRKAEKAQVRKENATPSKQQAQKKANPEPAKQQVQKKANPQPAKQQAQQKANPQPVKQQAQKKANPQPAKQQAQQKANPQRQQRQAAKKAKAAEASDEGKKKKE